MIIFRQKQFVHPAFHYLGGAAIGAGTGAGLGWYRASKDPEHRDMKKNILVGAGIGAGVGLGAVAAGKLLIKKYNKWLGKIEFEPVDVSKFKKGDIVIADRGAYQHYGIVVDDKGGVIEFGSHTFDPRAASVGRTNLTEFSGGSPLSVEKPNGKFTPDQIVQRAEAAIGDKRGGYNIRKSNCEHFAREIANGEAISTQVQNATSIYNNEELIDKLKYPGQSAKEVFEKGKDFIDSGKSKLSEIDQAKSMIEAVLGRKLFTQFTPGAGDHLIAQQFRHWVKEGGLEGARAKLARELGGLSHFNKHQTQYLSGGGALAGGGVGRITSEKKAKKDAEKYGLEEGTLEYDNFMKSRKREGMLKGAGIGGALGFGTSKAVDAIRGKVITDKAKVMYDGKLDLGKDYMKTGKALRGITSEEDIDNIVKNHKEIKDYMSAVYGML